MVISAITALYLLNVEQTAIQWFWINGFFGMAGQSKSAEYDYANVGPIWSYLVTNINAALLATTADSLLVRAHLHYPIIILPIISTDMEVLSLMEQFSASDTDTVSLAANRDR